MFDFLTDFASVYFKDRLLEIEDYKTGANDVQNEQMFNLVSEAQNTTWGKKYDFKSIFSYQDFRERLPIQHDADLQPYIRRMLTGEKNLLWPRNCKYFISSKNDKNSYLPLTQRMLDENFFQGIKDCYLIYISQKKSSKILDGYSLWLDTNSNNLVYKNFSSLLRNTLPFALEAITLPKSRKLRNNLPTILKESLHEKVTTIHGQPEYYAKFLEYIKKISGKQCIKDIWPTLEVFFHRSIPTLDQLQHPPIKDIDYFASYCTQEAFFGYQEKLNDPALLLMLDGGVFYEFLPVGAEIKPENVVPLGDIELSQNYKMILSTCSGLWRYCSQGPAVRFISKNPYKFILQCNH